jgi:hypothetical protein
LAALNCQEQIKAGQLEGQLEASGRESPLREVPTKRRQFQLLAASFVAVLRGAPAASLAALHADSRPSWIDRRKQKEVQNCHSHGARARK